MAENPYYDYVSGDSVIVPDTGAITQQVQNEWQNAFGTSLSLNPSTPQGRIIEMSVTARRAVLETCALVSNQINIDYATGQFLDGVGSLFTVSRKAATSSYALCTVTGVPGTVIPAGSRVSNSDGDFFVSRNSVTLNNSGSATVYFYAEQTGAIPVALNTIVAINSPVNGWETVNNDIASGVFVGSEQEGDNAFRARIKSSRYSGLSMLGSIKSAINKLDGLSGYALYNNPRNTSLTIKNEDGTDSPVVLDPHSICLIVAGGSNQEIGEALFNTVPVGCGYTALSGSSVTVSVPDEVGGRILYYEITFNTAVEVNAGVTVKVRSGNYSGEDLAAAIRNAISVWASGSIPEVEQIMIGKSVSPFEISAAISSQIPDIYIQEITIGENGSTQGYTPLVVQANEIVTIAAEDITVYIDGVESPAVTEL